MKSSEFEWLLYLVLIIITSFVPDGRFVSTIHYFRILSFFVTLYSSSVHPAHNLFTHVRHVIKILFLLSLMERFEFDLIYFSSFNLYESNYQVLVDFIY